jgi:regulator of protease activity HflC (stomatin/prohibitin superfamily)
MGLIVIGLIAVIVGVIVSRNFGPLTRYKSIFIFGGIIVAVVGFLTAAIRIIQPGHVGVQVLLGEVQEGVLQEGLNVVNPLIEVKEISVRRQNYTMSSTSAEGQVSGDDAITILSEDGLDVKIDLTLLYRVNPMETPRIFREIGPNFENVIIRPVTRAGIRSSASKFKAVQLFSEKRQEFEDEIRNFIMDTLSNRGFILDQILVRKIDLPASVKESIERKITAIQEAERMEFVLQKERREAERKKVEAEGRREAIQILNEGLSSKYLQFEYIQMQREFATSSNSKVIVLGGGDNAPPIFFNDK